MNRIDGARSMHGKVEKAHIGLIEKPERTDPLEDI
jgi:hypothetical protein